jgi:hypothetical protein
MLELNARVGYYKALVAIANKHARGRCSPKAKPATPSMGRR